MRTRGASVKFGEMEHDQPTRKSIITEDKGECLARASEAKTEGEERTEEEGTTDLEDPFHLLRLQDKVHLPALLPQACLPQ